MGRRVRAGYAGLSWLDVRSDEEFSGLPLGGAGREGVRLHLLFPRERPYGDGPDAHGGAAMLWLEHAVWRGVRRQGRFRRGDDAAKSARGAAPENDGAGPGRVRSPDPRAVSGGFGRS